MANEPSDKISSPEASKLVDVLLERTDIAYAGQHPDKHIKWWHTEKGYVTDFVNDEKIIFDYSEVGEDPTLTTYFISFENKFGHEYRLYYHGGENNDALCAKLQRLVTMIQQNVEFHFQNKLQRYTSTDWDIYKG